MSNIALASRPFLNFLGGACPQTPLGSKCLWHLQSCASAPSMLAYKSPRFSLAFQVFQSPSTSFTEVRVGSPGYLNSRHFNSQDLPETETAERGAVFDEVKRFPWQRSSDIHEIWLLDRHLTSLICFISYKSI